MHAVDKQNYQYNHKRRKTRGEYAAANADDTTNRLETFQYKYNAKRQLKKRKGVYQSVYYGK
jgi:hypothetical protein